MKKCALFLFLFITSIHTALAQASLSETLPEYTLHHARDLFDQKLYSLSLASARQYLAAGIDPAKTLPSSFIDEARYIIAVSLLRIDAPFATDSAELYLAATVQPAFRQRVSFAMAQYYFRHQIPQKAILQYELAGLKNLSNDEIAEQKFELAYCYFSTAQYDRARPMLASIIEIPGKYYNPGNYYYALLAYNEKDYPVALRSFERIANLPEYSTTAPYYIAEVNYYMGQRDKALAEAQRLMNAPQKNYYDKELHLLAAQILFERSDYKAAIPYFEFYYKNTDKVRKDELYEMGYSYYQTAAYDNAIDKLKELTDIQDSLGQTAMYILGDSYLKMGDKNSARNAFLFASDMDFVPLLRENALLLGGKLSYETNHNEDATTALETYIRAYPHSPSMSEARTLLTDLLNKTKNFSAAYALSIEISRTDEASKRFFQRAAYGYGLQKLQTGALDSAKTLFEESIEHSVNTGDEASAYFWLSDVAYRQQHYEEAIRLSNNFLKIDSGKNFVAGHGSAISDANAYLTMGYASMALKKYADAEKYFAFAGNSHDHALIAADARLRQADAAFMQKKYAAAMVLYDQAINTARDKDYAAFQKAVLLGLLGKTSLKISALQSLAMEGTGSYPFQARYELANTYIEQDKYQPALAELKLITATDNPYTARALLKTGFAHQQLSNPDLAIGDYSRVVAAYPSTSERQSALDALRSLYVETHRPEAYSRFLMDNHIISSSPDIDSAYFSSAQSLYTANAYRDAVAAFAKYLLQFPDGIFVIQAHYYRAEGEMHLKDDRAALTDYAYIANMSRNDYTLTSTRQTALLYNRLGAYDSSGKYYQRLFEISESSTDKINALRSSLSAYSHTTDSTATFELADSLLALAPGDEQATLVKANALSALGRDAEATALYQFLGNAKDPAIGAEAGYHLADHYRKQGDIKNAEENAVNAVKKFPGQEKWNVRAYFLVTDILVQQKDFFNAKATLRSIIRNTKDPALVKDAKARLDKIRSN